MKKNNEKVGNSFFVGDFIFAVVVCLISSVILFLFGFMVWLFYKIFGEFALVVPVIGVALGVFAYLNERKTSKRLNDYDN